MKFSQFLTEEVTGYVWVIHEVDIDEPDAIYGTEEKAVAPAISIINAQLGSENLDKLPIVKTMAELAKIKDLKSNRGKRSAFKFTGFDE